MTYRLRNQARRPAAALLGAALTVALTVAGPAAEAQAVVPGVAKTWSDLMTRSLTTTAQARTTLAAQQAAFGAKVSAVSAAKLANTTAQNRLIAASTTDATARSRHAAATLAVTNARKSLTVASAQKPRKAATVTKAKNAVAAATKAANARKAEAQKAAAALKTAQVTAGTATTGLGNALAAWKTASAAIRDSQQKLAASRAPNAYTTKAAALSRDVVTQVRATFTVADTIAVNGVTVHKAVAVPFQRMLDDAKADGVVLSGGGFRTTQRQIELRTINGCPDVWTAPSSSCRVPTAIPGRSLHEIGLAVDVTQGGRTLTAAGAGFKWMAAHADEYGFVNLPSEPWHWSITGG